MSLAMRIHSTLLLFMGLATIPLVGCGTVSHETTGPATFRVTPSSIPAGAPADMAMPALRYGRYTLIELVPERSQQDLMQQIIDITLPPTANATVGEALRYLLLRTGYQLCEHSEAGEVLDTLPLPAPHIHLGPLTLREALRMLVGPTWSLKIDDSTRRVCFEPVQASSPSTPSSTKPATQGAAR